MRNLDALRCLPRVFLMILDQMDPGFRSDSYLNCFFP